MTIDNEVIDLTKTAVTDTIQKGLNKYLADKLFGYNSPFTPLVNDAVGKLESLPILVQTAVDEIVKEPEFKAELKAALRKRLVNDIVKTFSLTTTIKEIRNSEEAKNKVIGLLEEISKS